MRVRTTWNVEGDPVSVRQLPELELVGDDGRGAVDAPREVVHAVRSHHRHVE